VSEWVGVYRPFSAQTRLYQRRKEGIKWCRSISLRKWLATWLLFFARLLNKMLLWVTASVSSESRRVHLRWGGNILLTETNLILIKTAAKLFRFAKMIKCKPSRCGVRYWSHFLDAADEWLTAVNSSKDHISWRRCSAFGSGFIWRVPYGHHRTIMWHYGRIASLVEYDVM